MIDIVHKKVIQLNSSTYFLAFMIVILNIGSKYLDLKIGYTMQKLLSTTTMKVLIIFTMIYTATRDIYKSIGISLVVLFLVEYILHEESSFCLIPNKYRCYKPVNKKQSNKSPYDITEKEVNDAIQVLTKAKLKHDCVKRDEIYEKFRYFSSI
jgi:hypothetical protein